jgi:hypothetical protein
MDAEEFEKLKEDHPDIYKDYIKKRKEEILLRKALIQQRKLQRELEKKRAKEGVVEEKGKWCVLFA